MVTIEIRFSAGRYHATPWGSHVNEGAVEWPPSPWRLLRALLAVGFAKHGWTKPPPAVATLVERLAGCLPSYRLPKSELAHTRHYMPIIEASAEKRTKVFDAFVRVPPNDRLLVHFDVQLSSEQQAALAELVGSLAYLGRAESWCEARLLSNHEQRDEAWCRPCETGAGPAGGGDSVSTLAPISQAAYAAWRESAVETALADEAERLSKKLSAAQRKKVVAAFPDNLLGCLLTDTATLQQYGWSQPPGTQRVLYQRPVAATPGAKRGRRVGGMGRSRRQRPVEAALLALASDTRHGQVLPLRSRALPQGELLHRSLCGLLPAIEDAKDDGERVAIVEACAMLTGCDEQGRPLRSRVAHQHAHILPLNLASDDQKRIDHFLVYAKGGLNEIAQRALLRLRQTWMKNMPGRSRRRATPEPVAAGIAGSEVIAAEEDPNQAISASPPQGITVNCAGMGSVADIRDSLANPGIGHDVRALQSGTTWTSLTPYICPKHYHRGSGRNRLTEIVRDELARRGLLADNDVKIDVWAKRQVSDARFFRYIRRRKRGKPQPPTSVPFGLTLMFDEPVPGPLAIGYGCHFGLGLMRVENP